MSCPNCGFDNPPGFAFCGRCGKPLEGAETPVPAESGERVFEGERLPTSFRPGTEPIIPQGERRNVTVLFADFSCFTPLSEQLDPEELTQVMQENFAELREEVLSRDGWLAKYMGDAVLAVFGAPVAHEDDPVRAVRTAIGMNARMASINARIEGRVTHPLQLHIGVNTGLVFAGPTTEADGHFTVLGDTVNTGARLQRVAGPGKIFVGEATYLASHWAFEYRKLAPLQVKGKRKSVIAYECLGPRAHPLSARGIEGIQVPMLGRSSEAAALRDAFSVASEGRPQVVSVLGDAGIGKSRLVREVIEELESTKTIYSWQVWTANATTDPPEPYGIARQMFREVLERPHPGSDEESLSKMLFGPLGLEGDEAPHLDPEHRKQRLYLLATQVVSRRSKEHTLIVNVEDLQWADVASVELLRFLAASPRGSRLLMLFTHRPEFEGPGAWEIPTEVKTIALDRLSDDVIRQLLGEYFGPSIGQFPAELVDKLVSGAGGNPFYLEELVRSLIQEGVIAREERWVVTEAAEKLVVPSSLQALLLARMDRLDADARLLLQEASVLGQRFSSRTLVDFVTSRDRLLAKLNDLIEGNWIEADDTAEETTYRFHHNLVREVAYESMLVRTRASLHARAAEIIEQQYADDLDEHIQGLAEHFYRAGDAKKGVIYLERAGDGARMIHANAEAVGAYRRALSLLGEGLGGDKARVLVSLGDALKAEARFEEAIEPWTEASRWFESHGDDTRTIAVLRRIANALWSQARVTEGRDHLDRALQLVNPEAERSQEVAALYHELANQTFHRGNTDEAVGWAEKALEGSQRIGAWEQAALAGTTLGVALARGGHIEAGQQSIEKALIMASEHEFPVAAGRAALNLAVLYAITDPMRAAEICAKGLEEARRIGDVSIQPWFYATLAGSLHACASDYETATESAEMAIEIDRQLGLRSHLPVPLIVLGQIHQCHDRWEQAESCFREALAIAEEVTDPQLLYPALEGLGTLYLERGDNETGEACMEKAQEVLASSGATAEGMMLLPFFL